MASAGGTWVKATVGPMAGQMVFVPALKSSDGKDGLPKGTGIQGGLHIAWEGGIWQVKHTESGTILAATPNMSNAFNAMGELNRQYRWSQPIDQIIAKNGNFSLTDNVINPIAKKYGGVEFVPGKGAKVVQAEQKAAGKSGTDGLPKTKAQEEKILKQYQIRQDDAGYLTMPDGTKFGPFDFKSAIDYSKTFGYDKGAQKAAAATGAAKAKAKAPTNNADTNDFIKRNSDALQEKIAKNPFDSQDIGNGYSIAKSPATGNYVIYHKESNGLIQSVAEHDSAVKLLGDFKTGKIVATPLNTPASVGKDIALKDIKNMGKGDVLDVGAGVKVYKFWSGGYQIDGPQGPEHAKTMKEALLVAQHQNGTFIKPSGVPLNPKAKPATAAAAKPATAAAAKPATAKPAATGTVQEIKTNNLSALDKGDTFHIGQVTVYKAFSGGYQVSKNGEIVKHTKNVFEAVEVANKANGFVKPAPKINPIVKGTQSAGPATPQMKAYSQFLKTKPHYEKTLAKQFKYDTGKKTRREFIEQDTNVPGGSGMYKLNDAKTGWYKSGALAGIKATKAEIEYWKFYTKGMLTGQFNP